MSITMGLRHIKPGLIAARSAGVGIFHPTLRHPITGNPLEAVGVVDGEVLWPIIGGGEDDDGGDEDGDDDDTGGDDDEQDDDDGDGEGDANAKITALTEEKDRHYKRRKKAEKERDDAKAEIERLKTELAKNGKKPAKKAKPAADDNADEDDDDTSNSELEAERAARRREQEAATAELRKAKIENAFLASHSTTKVEWVNPSHVMTLLLADDDYEVEFDDRGNIDRKSLVAELKRFAKANPHLVKPKPAKQGDADGNSGDGNTGSTGSASSMNGQRKGKGKTAQPTREQLAKRFPALGR